MTSSNIFKTLSRVNTKSGMHLKLKKEKRNQPKEKIKKKKLNS